MREGAKAVRELDPQKLKVTENISVKRSSLEIGLASMREASSLVVGCPEPSAPYRTPWPRPGVGVPMPGIPRARLGKILAVVALISYYGLCYLGFDSRREI